MNLNDRSHCHFQKRRRRSTADTAAGCQQLCEGNEPCGTWTFAVATAECSQYAGELELIDDTNQEFEAGTCSEGMARLANLYS